MLRATCVLAIALGAPACAEDAGPLARGDDDPLARQAAAASIPEGPGTVIVQTRQRVPLEITGHLGTGCEADLVVNEKARQDGRLQIYFRDYRMRLVPNTLTYDSRDCTLALEVTGARGYRYAIQQVTYVGSASLYSPRAEARFSSTVWWSGRGPEQAAEPRVITGVYVQDWVHTQTFPFEEIGTSACFRAPDQHDEITIQTTMVLFNPDTQLPAEVMLNALVGEASIVTRSARAAAVTLDLEARPCAPPI